jgi:acetyl-CoA synthetase
MASTETTHDDLARRLEELQETERFDPPEEFVANALDTDDSFWKEAEQDPTGWWAKQAEELHWFKPWDSVLDDSDPPFHTWFAGGKINASYNCLDRHVENGLGDRVAIHWRGEEGEERDVTYAWLLEQVQRFANVLKDNGVQAGDVVGIFMPMIPEVVVAMLACARIGAPHNVVFGGFSPESVKERMETSEAKVLVTVDGARRKGKTAPIKPAVDEVMGDVASIEKIVVVKATGTDCDMQEGRDIWWHEAMEAAAPECPAEELDAEHPLYILYSSGSTNKPKGILHTTGGYLTGVAWTMKHVFDLKPDTDVYWCAADVGWVTGHSYIIYGPLLNGVTGVMYEGPPDYPSKDHHWRLIEELGVTIYYFAPTAIRSFMKWGAELPAKHDLSSLRLLGTVGEPINPKAWLWYREVIGLGETPVVDTWWQTETGQILITTLPGAQYMKPGSAGTPLPGIAAEIRDESSGEEVGPNKQGLLVLTRPWPGMLRTLYKDKERFVETYFKRFGPETYLVGDAARRDPDGYYWIIGRIDDVLNVSGHRMSTAEIESAIVSHEVVAEAAVIGQSDEDTGQAVTAFVTLEGDREGDDELIEAIREHVAKRIGKLARPKRIIWADDLPKTRSGKIMRRLLRDIAEGRELGDVTTLRDPDVMQQLQGKISQHQEEED